MPEVETRNLRDILIITLGLAVNRLNDQIFRSDTDDVFLTSVGFIYRRPFIPNESPELGSCAIFYLA